MVLVHLCDGVEFSTGPRGKENIEERKLISNKSPSRCSKERTLFKCELIFCCLIFVQAKNGSYKLSCDSCFKQGIPFGSMLHASANKMSLFKANVILVLGQKSEDNGLASLPACLLNGQSTI